MTLTDTYVERAKTCLDRRDNHPATAEADAMAAVAYCLLALLREVTEGVIYTRDADRV